LLKNIFVILPKSLIICQLYTVSTNVLIVVIINKHKSLLSSVLYNGFEDIARNIKNKIKEDFGFVLNNLIIVHIENIKTSQRRTNMPVSFLYPSNGVLK
jgi:hypothetical protein